MHHCYVGTPFRPFTEEDEVDKYHAEKALLPAPPLSKLRVAELDELIGVYQSSREHATWNWRGMPDRAMSVYLADLDGKIKELQDMRASKSKKKRE